MLKSTVWGGPLCISVRGVLNPTKWIPNIVQNAAAIKLTIDIAATRTAGIINDRARIEMYSAAIAANLLFSNWLMIVSIATRSGFSP
jgi:hypothetical protein